MDSSRLTTSSAAVAGRVAISLVRAAPPDLLDRDG
jgi:hypothetical protein